MLCPTCQTPLTMSERQGIEIDYCPSCRGVWLDRGELDKIIERSTAMQTQPAPPAPPPQYGSQGQGYVQGQGYGQGQDYSRGHRPHHKRRKSFLEELFD
jgi:uncharacterized protein